MNNLKLIAPTTEFKAEFLEMLTEWEKTGEELIPWVLEFDTSDFPAIIKKLRGFEQGIGLQEGYVNHSTYWLINGENKILGAVNIRHKLNEDLLKSGGHIGYGIRPSERKKGYATEALRLSLEIAKEFGIHKALLTCDKKNIGSAKTIQKHHGILESEELYNGKMLQRYWIYID